MTKVRARNWRHFVPFAIVPIRKSVQGTTSMCTNMSCFHIMKEYSVSQREKSLQCNSTRTERSCVDDSLAAQ